MKRPNIVWCDSLIVGRETAYERERDVATSHSHAGTTLDADGNGINLCYGAADTSVALAKASIAQLLE